MEKIFVVVPVYKVEPYLERCVDSILKQTYTNWELVLVDDGSPDNCPAICDRYAAEHGNITVVHQDNGGLSAARNAGIEYALKHGDLKNNWISFIDSDDFVHPCYLEYLYRAAKEAGADVSSCGYTKTSGSDISLEDIRFVYSVPSPEEFWCQDRTNATIACGKLYTIQSFENVCFPIGKVHEDEFTTYRILFAKMNIAVMKLPLYYYYIHTDSITHTEWSPKRLLSLDALEEQISYFQQNGFSSAYNESLRHLLQHCIKNLMYIKNLSPKYDHLIKEVAIRRNRAFQQYRNAVGYQKALAYWYEVRIKSPMKRVLGNETVFSFLKRKIKKKLNKH